MSGRHVGCKKNSRHDPTLTADCQYWPVCLGIGTGSGFPPSVGAVSTSRGVR